MEHARLEITWGSLWRIFAFLLFVLIFYLSRNILVMLSLTIVFSSALDPMVNYLESKKINRLVGTISAFMVFFSILALIVYAIAPIFVFELRNLFSDVGKISADLFGLGIPQNILNQINISLESLFRALAAGSTSIVSLAFNFIGNITLAFIGVIITFYLTFQKNGVEKFLRAVLPPSYEDIAVDIYQNAKRKIGVWFRAQLFLSFVVGLAVFIALSILGVKYSLVLGILAAVLEIFPVIGPIIGGTAAALIAFTDSAMLAVYTVVTFAVIQQLEGTLLVPNVMSRAVGLNPVIVLIALLVGAQIAGVTGLILAVPVAVVMQEIIDNWGRYKAKQSRLNV